MSYSGGPVHRHFLQKKIMVMKKEIRSLAEIAAMLVALLVLGSETDSLTVFVLSKLIAMAVFVGCAWDMDFI